MKYLRFWPPFFTPCKSVLTEIWVGLGLHAYRPVALKHIYSFLKQLKCARQCLSLTR